MTITLTVTLSGADTSALVEHAARIGWTPPGALKSLEVDFEDAPAGETFAAGLARARRHVLAEYPYPGMVVVHVGSLVRVIRGEFEVAMPRLLEQLADLPFELASFGPIYPIWKDADGEKYWPPGFGDNHVSLGWAAAFRGRGHDRLVSRRWLETGPWRLHRGPGDVSLIELHDLDADAATALAVAGPRHQALVGEHGGYLQTGFVHQLALEGLYDRATRTMKVVVLGRELSDRELLEWAAARAESGGERPIDAVAFVFPDEREAQANLARLWRYGHQCWAIRAGDEVRLDGDSAP